jgi:hypothetical protein
LLILGIIASSMADIGSLPPPISTRWRVLISETAEVSTFENVRIAEIEWLDAAGDVIPATGMYHTASSIVESNSPNNAFDGNPTTYWNGYRDDGTLYGQTAWISTEFDDPEEVRGVRLTGGPDELTQNPREFSIQYLSPAGSWITLFKVYSQVMWVAGEERTFRQGMRVWRFVINTTTDGSVTTLAEVEFRTTEGIGESNAGAGGFPLVSSFVTGSDRFGAFDEDNNEAWSADVLPAYIEYWFPETKDVAEVAVFASTGFEDQLPATAQLFYSDDYGLNYTEVDPFSMVEVEGGYGYLYGYFYGGV